MTLTAPEPRVPPVPLVGDGALVPCVDGNDRPYLSCDAAASTAPFEHVLRKVQEFMPWYSSIHRGAGFKSQRATAAYEEARSSALRFAGRSERDDVAIICRNTTEAVNHLVYRLGLTRSDVVVTTVVEHHANLLPWSRSAHCRYVECEKDGTFSLEAVLKALDERPSPKLLAITAASNITGWMPPVSDVVEAAHSRGVPVAVDAAQLAPHRPLCPGADYIAWSAHKMYAPFGAGVLIGPRKTFSSGDPFLAGGGAVDLVSLDEVVWTDPPDREEAGSPNVVGAVALGAAIEQMEQVGWEAIVSHDRLVARTLRQAISGVPGVRLLGPDLAQETLPVATFVVEGMPHSLVAARLSAEAAIGVRHGCFCAHPYLLRLLELSAAEVERFRDEVLRGDRRHMPGAVRASLGINASEEDVSRLVSELEAVVSEPSAVSYVQDTRTGDWSPDVAGDLWPSGLTWTREHGSSCSPG